MSGNSVWYLQRKKYEKNPLHKSTFFILIQFYILWRHTPIGRQTRIGRVFSYIYTIFDGFYVQYYSIFSENSKSPKQALINTHAYAISTHIIHLYKNVYDFAGWNEWSSQVQSYVFNFKRIFFHTLKKSKSRFFLLWNSMQAG